MWWVWWLLAGWGMIWLGLTIKRRRSAFQLRGKLCVITGAARGIGRELALQLARQSGDSGLRGLALWGLHRDSVEELRSEIAGLGLPVEVAAMGCDVSSLQQVQAAHAETLRAFPWAQGVDMLVNNAGIVIGKSFAELQPAHLERTLAVNTMSHWWTLKTMLPHMVARNCGQIVTISSVLANIPSCDLADYCASKAAAAQFHHSLRLELRRAGAWGVRTTLVCPYAVSTGMFEGIRLLLPHLTPQSVAADVIAAVRHGLQVLYLPRYFSFLIFFASLVFPTEVHDFLLEFGGSRHGMATFSGRGVQAAMGSS